MVCGDRPITCRFRAREVSQLLQPTAIQLTMRQEAYFRAKAVRCFAVGLPQTIGCFERTETVLIVRVFSMSELKLAFYTM
jgi:hypothetical protein